MFVPEWLDQQVIVTIAAVVGSVLGILNSCYAWKTRSRDKCRENWMEYEGDIAVLLRANTVKMKEYRQDLDRSIYRQPRSLSISTKFADDLPVLLNENEIVCGKALLHPRYNENGKNWSDAIEKMNSCILSRVERLLERLPIENADSPSSIQKIELSELTELRDSFILYERTCDELIYEQRRFISSGRRNCAIRSAWNRLARAAKSWRSSLKGSGRRLP